MIALITLIIICFSLIFAVLHQRRLIKNINQMYQEQKRKSVKFEIMYEQLCVKVNSNHYNHIEQRNKELQEQIEDLSSELIEFKQTLDEKNYVIDELSKNLTVSHKHFNQIVEELKQIQSLYAMLPTARYA